MHSSTSSIVKNLPTGNINNTQTTRGTGGCNVVTNTGTGGQIWLYGLAHRDAAEASNAVWSHVFLEFALTPLIY